MIQNHAEVEEKFHKHAQIRGIQYANINNYLNGSWFKEKENITAQGIKSSEYSKIWGSYLQKMSIHIFNLSFIELSNAGSPS